MHTRRAIGLVTVVVAGALAGRVLAPSPAPHRVVRAGPATLVVPNERAADRIAVAFGPPADRTLVPRELRAKAAGEPDATRLGGHRAWTYSARGSQITVLPTSRGVLGLACANCARAIASVDIKATILTPAPDLAFTLRFRPVLDAVDASRVRLRSALAQARTRTARASAASALAREHAAAAERLTGLAGPGTRAIVARLADSAAAYRALAAAAPVSAARFNAARHAVDTADARLLAAVARLRLVYRPQPPLHPSPRSVRHWPTAALWLLVALAGALLAGWPRRAPQPRPTINDRAPAPPPGWRWDTPPRSGGAGPLSALSEPPPPARSP